MSDELKTAIEAAKAGAKVALKYFDQEIKIDIKEDNTPVTIADKETEQEVKKVILGKFASATFLGEESSDQAHGKDFWTIDPIDGTANYIRGLPFWAVELAYVQNGECLVGVSYCPVLDELFYAERGKGAFKNGKRTFVSKVRRPQDAFFIHGTIKYFKVRMKGFLALCETVFRQRGFGDFYGYHQVACGRADIMMDAKNHAWDMAALNVIIEEAGGKHTNFDGSRWNLDDPTSIATNGFIHEDVLKILNEK